jgi:peptidoglycan/LPS O-acetylase OafA/YrhL
LLSGGLDPNVSFGGTGTLIACIVGVVLVPLAMPWGYVFEHFVKAPGDRWGKKQVTVRPPLPSDEPKIVT